MQNLIILLASIFINVNAVEPFKYAVLSAWEVKRTSGDIEFSYRNVRVGDTLETKEMRMVFPINASPDRVIPYFRDPELFMAWSPDVDSCELLYSNGPAWTLYKYYNMPWPLSERDIVTEYQLDDTDSLVHMKILGVPGNYPEREGVVRIREYEGQWFLRKVDEGLTNIEFRTVQLGKPVGPRAIQDRIIEKSFIKSVSLLRELAESWEQGK